MVLSGNDIKLRDLGFELEYLDPHRERYYNLVVKYRGNPVGRLHYETGTTPEETGLHLAMTALYAANAEFKNFIDTTVPDAAQYLT
jgi:hypothetical protein